MTDGTDRSHTGAPPWHRNPWLWAAVIGVVGITVLRPYCARRMRHVPKPPPVLGKVPAFRLVQQDGKPYGLAELKGHVTVVDFIFTRCRSICPRMTAQMKKLQDRFARAKLDVRLLSISVDPENDTPERLRAYAKRHGADPARWTFLTGPPKAVTALIETGFRAHVGKKVQVKSLIDIAHTTRFFLVDRKGRIRGRYPSDDDGIDEVFARAKQVLGEKE